MSKVQQIIKHYIKDYNCLVFSKLDCPYCFCTKEFFESKGIRFKSIEIDREPEYQAELEAMTGQKTVPSIWINGKFIGGNSDLMKKYSNGELVEDFLRLKQQSL